MKELALFGYLSEGNVQKPTEKLIISRPILPMCTQACSTVVKENIQNTNRLIVRYFGSLTKICNWDSEQVCTSRNLALLV